MKIQWLGHACFKITQDSFSIVIDPYNYKYAVGYPELKVSADMLLISHDHYGHNCREAVTLSGKSESECPFEISSFDVWHDHHGGIMRGKGKVHILEAGDMKIVHMGDIGTKLTDHEQGLIFGADAMMVTAGSCTGLPSQEVWRLTEAVFPKVIIPMHYRHSTYTNRRLEHLDALLNYYESPELVHYYDTDTLELEPDTEPQIAVLKYMGGNKTKTPFPRITY